MFREDYFNTRLMCRATFSVLVTSLLILTIGCQSPNENVKVSQTAATTESNVVLASISTNDVNQADLLASAKPISIAAANGKELDFDSSEKDVLSLLGKPTSKTSLNGVTFYNYKNESSDSELYESAVYFIENKMSILTIGNKTIEGPKGIRCGDDMAKAIVLFASPAQLKELGIEKGTSVSDIHNLIAEKNSFELNFEIDGLLKLNVSYSNDYTITKIHIWRSVEQTQPVEITATDFDANVSELVAKFGYPIAIDMYPPDSIWLGYNDKLSNNLKTYIALLNRTFDNPNYFYVGNEWVSENGVSVGKKKSELETILKVKLDDLINHNYRSKYNGDNYDIHLSFSGDNLESYDLKRVTIPNFSTSKLHSEFVLPTFDPESIATADDMYLSGLRFGSSREDVFKILGAPIDLTSGFQENTRNYQDCNFQSGSVAFLDVTDGRDLKTGRAYDYQVSDKDIIGPRGLKVGDPIARVLDVFPGNNAINFEALEKDTIIYEEKPNEERNSAIINPYFEHDVQNSGTIYIDIDWYMGVTIMYENGLIKEFGLGQMLD